MLDDLYPARHYAPPDTPCPQPQTVMTHASPSLIRGRRKLELLNMARRTTLRIFSITPARERDEEGVVSAQNSIIIRDRTASEGLGREAEGRGDGGHGGGGLSEVVLVGSCLRRPQPSLTLLGNTAERSC